MRTALILLVLAWSSLGAQELSTLRHLDKRFTLCRFSSPQGLTLHLNGPEGRPYRSFDTLNLNLSSKGRKLVFAMNGGMYHPGFSPVGLFVENGRESAALNLEGGQGNFFLKPNGVLAWNADRAWILESRAFLEKKLNPLWATQSGPMLVIDREIHPAFNPRSVSRLRRNGVGLDRRGELLFCISEEPVTFFEMASLFKNALSCDNALYLDGTISSLFAPALGRNDGNYPLGPMIALDRALAD